MTGETPAEVRVDVRLRRHVVRDRFLHGHDGDDAA